VVLTLGADGAWAIGPEEQVFEPAQRVEVVDTVGAGDCFFAGFIALSRQGVPLREHAPPSRALAEALRTRCAAINIGRKGAACRPGRKPRSGGSAPSSLTPLQANGQTAMAIPGGRCATGCAT
jgi:sugar/nucleoside kinase (ribokinase family)